MCCAATYHSALTHQPVGNRKVLCVQCSPARGSCTSRHPPAQLSPFRLLRLLSAPAAGKIFELLIAAAVEPRMNLCCTRPAHAHTHTRMWVTCILHTNTAGSQLEQLPLPPHRPCVSHACTPHTHESQAGNVHCWYTPSKAGIYVATPHVSCRYIACQRPQQPATLCSPSSSLVVCIYVCVPIVWSSQSS